MRSSVSRPPARALNLEANPTSKEDCGWEQTLKFQLELGVASPQSFSGKRYILHGLDSGKREQEQSFRDDTEQQLLRDGRA